MASTASAHPTHRPWWAKVLIGLAVLVLALVLLAVLFPWDTLRGPVNRYVSEKTGRHFEITRHLDVKLGRTTRVLMDGIEFANPDWAQDKYLVKADAAEVHVRLLPLLLHRTIELPFINLTRPQLGLQMEPDGRRTWALGGDTRNERNVPQIGAVVVDQGTAHYVAREQGADIRAEFAMHREAATGNAAQMPLRFKAAGRWQDQPFNAEGRTGDVLSLNAPQQRPFPAEVRATAGATSLRAGGSVANLAALDGADVAFQLRGDDLGQLHKLIGVVLPNTPRYSFAGRLTKQGEVFRVRDIEGRLGRSDIAGELAFDKGSQRPSAAGPDPLAHAGLRGSRAADRDEGRPRREACRRAGRDGDAGRQGTEEGAQGSEPQGAPRCAAGREPPAQHGCRRAGACGPHRQCEGLAAGPHGRACAAEERRAGARRHGPGRRRRAGGRR